MPGFDRSGPMGGGSQTGRGMGKCNPDTSSSDQCYGFGRGMACRRGFGAGFGGAGRGWGRGVNFFGPVAGSRQSVVSVDEQEALKKQADKLQESLSALQHRLDALEEKK